MSKKITKSELIKMISEEVDKAKRIKSLENKKSAILESIKKLEEGNRPSNERELSELLDITNKEELFDMLWSWQSADDQAEFLEHAKSELGIEEEEDDDEEEDNDNEEEELEEKKMTKPEKRKREDIVMALKDKMKDFKDRYGKKAKDVMYATATKMAMNEPKKDK
jgi:hypothetical protein